MSVPKLTPEQMQALPASVKEVLQRQQDEIAKAHLKLGKAADSLETFKVYDLPNRSAVWMHTGEKGGVVCVFKKNGTTISGGMNFNLNVAELLQDNKVSRAFQESLSDYISEYGEVMGKRANDAAISRKRK
jgi:hypothetical protein